MPTEDMFARAGGNFSLAVALPLGRAVGAGGYLEIADIRSMLKQNVKMLLLTRPGERMMDSEFGVGVQNYLFENFNTGTYEAIRTRIYDQMTRYIPAVTIVNIEFDHLARYINKQYVVNH